MAVADNISGSGVGTFYGWVDAVDPLSDPYNTLNGGNPDLIRLGAKAFDAAGGATDTFGPFCLIDLSDITGGVDQEVREGIRDAWDDADMDWEVFFADLLSKFDAWTGPSGGDTIVITYWKINNVVPYGQEIDTDNIISRYQRTLTRGSALPAEGAATTTSDVENAAGFPFKTLGDSFAGSGLWMDASHTIDFGDHADFSFAGGSDAPFSYVVWSDAYKNLWAQFLLYKNTEYRILLPTNGKLYFYLYDAQGDTIYTVSNAVRADGTLHCWVFTYNGNAVDGDDLTIYEDGAVIASTGAEVGAYGAMPDSANSLLIDNITAGHIYNAQLYNRELSASEIKALYDQGPYR